MTETLTRVEAGGQPWWVRASGLSEGGWGEVKVPH